MTIYNDIIEVTICIKYGQGLFWIWWGNLIDILIFNKIFINIRKNTT